MEALKTNSSVFKTYFDQDMVNLGIWLNVKGEFFSWDHKTRFIKWFSMFFMILVTQVGITVELMIEAINNNLELADSLKLIFTKNEEKFNKLDYGMQDYANNIFTMFQTYSLQYKWYAVFLVLIVVIIVY